MKLKRLAAMFLPLFLLTGCGAQGYQTDFFAMNTIMRVQVDGKDAQTVAGAVVQRVNALDKLLSRTREDSAVYALNHDGGVPQQNEAMDYLRKARDMAEQTGGYYDPTVATLTDLWGIGTDEARVPAQAEIDETLQTVGLDKLTLTSETAQLTGGAQIDLGGIAKGMAADETAAILREHGASGLLALGGNIYAVGTNGGEPWKIGIADPDNPQEYLATVAISDLSVVTTGDYERYFEQDGKRYHHVFDPKTGYPAETDLRSVTVLGQASADCDAYSTALFVMGRERGLAFCEQNGIAAVFIAKDKTITTSSAVQNVCTFALTGADKGYVYAG